MTEPIARRPFMPGYGIEPAEDGAGLLPWAWALERLARSHDYWLATVRPDGAPHLMPVWGVWLDEALWFSSGLGSRKARNLERAHDVTVATDDAQQPVIIDGRAARVTDLEVIERFALAVDTKYAVGYGAAFYDPERNGTYRVAPHGVFGLDTEDFTGTPTRWHLDG